MTMLMIMMIGDDFHIRLNACNLRQRMIVSMKYPSSFDDEVQMRAFESPAHSPVLTGLRLYL